MILVVWRFRGPVYTTLINRTAQIKQLLIDGVNPDTLPVYFNRMMDVSQDILIIHGDGINKIVNRTNVSDDILNNIPATETISAAGIYRILYNSQKGRKGLVNSHCRSL